MTEVVTEVEVLTNDLLNKIAEIHKFTHGSTFLSNTDIQTCNAVLCIMAVKLATAITGERLAKKNLEGRKI